MLRTQSLARQVQQTETEREGEREQTQIHGRVTSKLHKSFIIVEITRTTSLALIKQIPSTSRNCPSKRFVNFCGTLTNSASQMGHTNNLLATCVRLLSVSGSGIRKMSVWQFIYRYTYAYVYISLYESLLCGLIICICICLASYLARIMHI